MATLRSRVIAQAKKTSQLRSRVISHRKAGGRSPRLRRAYHRSKAELARLRVALANERDPRKKAAKWALAQVGTREATGHNDGPKILRWQRHTARGAKYLDGAPYCGIGCENACAHAGVKTFATWASVAEIENLAKKNIGGFRGWTGDRDRVRLGDLVVLFGHGIHVEFVLRVRRNEVLTVGFNTSPDDKGSQANGGGVFIRRRPFSQVRGYALVRYPN